MGKPYVFEDTAALSSSFHDDMIEAVGPLNEKGEYHSPEHKSYKSGTMAANSVLKKHGFNHIAMSTHRDKMGGEHAHTHVYHHPNTGATATLHHFHDRFSGTHHMSAAIHQRPH